MLVKRTHLTFKKMESERVKELANNLNLGVVEPSGILSNNTDIFEIGTEDGLNYVKCVPCQSGKMTKVESLEAHRLRQKHCFVETSKYLYKENLRQKALIKFYEAQIRVLAKGSNFRLHRATLTPH